MAPPTSSHQIEELRQIPSLFRQTRLMRRQKRKISFDWFSEGWRLDLSGAPDFFTLHFPLLRDLRLSSLSHMFLEQKKTNEFSFFIFLVSIISRFLFAPPPFFCGLLSNIISLSNLAGDVGRSNQMIIPLYVVVQLTRVDWKEAGRISSAGAHSLI